MGKIVQLDNHLSNMIAAGEVVERPMSVVKELVENSIDAESTRINVNLLDSGVKLINVIDDGCGMSNEDALMAFGRHATSKIKSERDLFRILTLGFRGEAIPSIASVSKMTLLTNDGSMGFEIVYQAGKKLSALPHACNKGTNIKVENLFYNTPARLKYLKSLPTELAQVSTIMTKFALSRPDISFSLSNNGNEILNTSGKNDLVRLFGEIYGLDIARNLLINEYKSVAFDLKLCICKSTITRSNKNEITIICNGRYVKSYKLTDALIEAYATYIPHTRYPIGVIYLNLDPLLIDVNIHPSKAIIKISNEDEIAQKVKQMAMELLKESNMIPQVPIMPKKDGYEKISFLDESFIEKETRPIIEEKKEEVVLEEPKAQYKKIPTNEVIEESPNMVVTKRLPYLEYVGQVHGTYLIFQNEEGMYIMDQHAAAERINYEKYYNILSKPSDVRTTLLIPYELEFTPTEMIFINEHIMDLRQIGIDIDQISKQSYLIREVPYWMDFDHIDEFIRNLINMFMKNKEVSIIKNRDRIAKQIACKDSIKANHSLTKEEVLHLIEALNKCNNPYTCPHGRPSIIKMSSKDLEKLFLRIM
ncbi:MAG: DNA mismatch repair endonuclease MutL [Anaeroplasmataceae bacterium]